MRPITAFTLIELLVVIAVIMILSVMLMAVLPMIMFTSRASVTTQRMEEVQRNLSALGQETGSISQVLARRCLAIPTESGVLRWLPKTTTSGGRAFDSADLIPATPPSSWGTWLATPTAIANLQHFRWPWPQLGLDGRGRPISVTSTAVEKAESTHNLSILAPHRTTEFLATSGLLPAAIAPATDGRASLYNDRSPNRPWNDRWGNPLVVAYGIYQPYPDWTALNRAQLSYGFTRALYLSIASAGPALAMPQATGTADAVWNTPETGNFALIWRQANDVCNSVSPTSLVSAGGTQTWRTDYTIWAAGVEPVNAFSNPPWTGIKRGRLSASRCFLSAPIELK